MQNNVSIDKNFFPGWTRKSVTFSIDDGNFRLDTKFLEIMRPKGFKGTFNLVSSYINPNEGEKWRELYRGYEIANHCKYHPFVFLPGVEYHLSGLPFDRETAKDELLYNAEIDGMYYIKNKNNWRRIATVERYKQCVTDGHRELEAVFGEGSVRGYVWPYNKQNSPEIFAWLKEQGYFHIRRSLCLDPEFSMPTDRHLFNINAWYTNLPETSAAYDSLADDGNLKFFCLGTHSHDFENNGVWHLLVDFAERFGNRPNDFYYASISEIFDYEDALNALSVTEKEIINNSDLAVYIKVNGEKVMISPHSSYIF